MQRVPAQPRPSTSAISHVGLPGVTWEATRVALPAPLHAAEAEHIQHAVEKRRAEFATVRACAGRALGRLGVARLTMVPGPRGEPRWPAGMVGSMTHTDRYYAAAVAHSDVVAALGIDAEPNRPLPDRVIDRVAAGAERDQARSLRAINGSVAWDRLLFSAKEVIYKIWYPEINTWLGFEDVEVTMQPDGTFTARLIGVGHDARGAELLRRVAGHWWSDLDHIVTGAMVSATSTLP